MININDYKIDEYDYSSFEKLAEESNIELKDIKRLEFPTQPIGTKLCCNTGYYITKKTKKKIYFYEFMEIYNIAEFDSHTILFQGEIQSNPLELYDTYKESKKN